MQLKEGLKEIAYGQKDENVSQNGTARWICGEPADDGINFYLQILAKPRIFQDSEWQNKASLIS